jgi:hypothetical protein
MASATDDLERIIYKLIFNAAFGSSVIDTNNLSVKLTTGDNLGEDGAGGQIFVNPPAGAGEAAAEGYNDVPLVNGGDVFEDGDTGGPDTWDNVQSLNFGNNTGSVNWPTITGWGIWDSSLGTFLLYGNFITAGGNVESYIVEPGNNFSIPVSVFKITID